MGQEFDAADDPAGGANKYAYLDAKMPESSAEQTLVSRGAFAVPVPKLAQGELLQERLHPLRHFRS